MYRISRRPGPPCLIRSGSGGAAYPPPHALRINPGSGPVAGAKTDDLGPCLCYLSPMSRRPQQPPRPIDEAARQRGLEMQHLLLIEGNPLTADEVAMFEMFDREGWSHERRRAHILATVQRAAPPEAAE